LTITGWRLVSERWLGTAFTGEGARLSGGRWNSKGVPVVYLGGSLALAALELLAHLDHKQALEGHYAVPVTFDRQLTMAVDKNDLPPEFPQAGTILATQRLGDTWVERGESPLLRVPSAVIPQEHNYLFNPAQEEAGRVEIGQARPFTYDRRLVRKQESSG
jgi:RES domain-containing protein